jgi:hypothetical protein
MRDCNVGADVKISNLPLAFNSKRGHRHIAVAKKMKAEGQFAGIPDLFLPHAAHGFHGLYIEVKTVKGVLSEQQETIQALLKKHGYAVEIVRSISEGVKLLQWYCEVSN